MSGGYMGKILFVDLSTGEIREEGLDEQLCRNFIGGYGMGARMLYSRQKAGADPLGPENTLGFLTGPFTGTIVPPGARYMVFAKSPLTGGWGEANSGGFFGPYLKFAGFDGVFFTGISPKPVYLLLDDGKAELKDAGYLWGKDTYETEDILMAEYKESRVVCIGQAGEKLALVSCIMSNHGDAAGRSGLGAVMGSKRLKALVARGTKEVVIADKAAAQKFIVEHIKTLRIVGPTGMTPMEKQQKYGTSFTTYNAAHNGDAPVKNWGGVGVVDLPNRAGLHPDVFRARVEKGHGCWHCPIRCKAILKAGEGEYKYAAGVHRPEYEGQTSFGALCANSHTESIIMANDICNRAGLDTISSGSIIAFTTELYEKGIITNKDTDGIDLKWGNHQAMVAMTMKLAKREGIGDILALGVKRAAEKIGKGAEQYAMHIGGQEVAMHDPKVLGPGRMASPAARYKMDATPGRHTVLFGGPYSFTDTHFLNVTGLCHFGRWPENEDLMVGVFNAVTGWNFTWKDFQKTGERVVNMRHVFNLREGINELNWTVPPRLVGNPPQPVGPLAGVTADVEAQVQWGLGFLDWDRFTTKPSKAKLLSLGGMDDVAKDLWP